MRNYFLLAGLLLYLQGHSQQYLIRYDLHGQQTGYYKIDQKDTLPVKKIDLPATGQLLLQVENYNPFYWDARVTAIRTAEENQQSFSDVFNPFSVLAGSIGEMIGGLPLLDLPKNRGSISKEDYDEKTYRRYSRLLRYGQLYAQVQQYVKKMESLQLARIQLQELKMNPELTGTEIKERAKLLTRKVLLTDYPEIESVLETGRQTDFTYNSLISETAALADVLRTEPVPADDPAEADGRSLAELYNTSSGGFAAVQQLKNNLEDHPSFFTEQMMSVAGISREIAAARFRFSYAVEYSNEFSGVKLQLYAKHNKQEGTDTLVQYFEVSRRRPLKIRNSLGLAFSHFSSNNTTYSIANGVLQSGPKDLFTPVLSTFIHFYTGKTGSFKWGGALGFGIPLQAEKKEVHFMLGLSAILGRNEMIMVSAGLAGARVTKLLNGYKAGEPVAEPDISKITTLGYSAGAYLAVSLNLSSFTNGSK